MKVLIHQLTEVAQGDQCRYFGDDLAPDTGRGLNSFYSNACANIHDVLC